MKALASAAVLLAAAEAAAIALWLLPASVDIVSWPPGGPRRLALLAPAARLVGLCTAALLGAVLVWAWARRDRTRLQVATTIASPVCLLWLWLVPYLPLVPDRLPLLLVLAGPLRWVVALLAGVGSVWSTGWLTGWRLAFHPSWDRRVVFAASLLMYVAFGLMQARTFGPGGDEPHYLIIIDSLIKDGDLQIENNHQRGDYKAYFRGGELRPDYMARGTNGAIYSVHAAGLPILLTPAYAVAGYLGAVAMLGFVGALAALAVFDIGNALSGRLVAWLTWCAVCVSIPFVPYAWSLFPEMPGALIVAWATLWLLRPIEQPTRRWLVRGLMLATLLWLHTKFVILLATFAAALFLRLWRRPRLAVAFALPIAVSGVLWLASFYVVYGTIDPQAPYGPWTANLMNENIPRGLLGLAFDQKFGMLFYAPIYISAVAGCWLLLRDRHRRFLGSVLLLVVCVHLASTTRLYMWWGGSSAPARFAVPILPCLAAMIAVALHAASSRASRALLGAWLGIGVSVALVGAAAPERLWLFSEPHGRGRLVEALQASSPLAFVYPTFTAQDWRTPLAALGPWLAAAAVSLCLVYVAGRWWPRRSALWLATFGSLSMLFTAAVGTASPDPAAREDATRRGTLDVLWRFDGSLRGFDYVALRRLTHAQILERSKVVDRRSPAGPYVLPPGAYEARVWLAGGLAREGSVVVSSSRAATFGRVAGILSNPAVVPFELPVPTSRIMVSAGGDGGTLPVLQTEVIPQAVVPWSDRLQARTWGIESVAETGGAYIIYLDRDSYPEGGVFWTRATRPASILLAPGGAPRVSLTLHLGPRAGEVSVRAAGVSHVVKVPANDTARLDIPVPEGLRLMPVTVQSPTSFVPAEVSTSTDTRQLGCQVRVEIP